MKVDIVKSDELGHFKIFIDGLLHLKLFNKIEAFHTYIDEKSDGVNKWMMYYIDFHLLTGSVVHCEYNRRDLWEEILKGL